MLVDVRFPVSRLRSYVRLLAVLILTAWLLTGNAWIAPAQKPRPPHGQDHMPGPALSPAEAIKKMTVPPTAFTSSWSPPSRTSSIRWP